MYSKCCCNDQIQQSFWAYFNFLQICLLFIWLWLLYASHYHVEHFHKMLFHFNTCWFKQLSILATFHGCMKNPPCDKTERHSKMHMNEFIRPSNKLHVIEIKPQNSSFAFDNNIYFCILYVPSRDREREFCVHLILMNFIVSIYRPFALFLSLSLSLHLVCLCMPLLAPSKVLCFTMSPERHCKCQCHVFFWSKISLCFCGNASLAKDQLWWAIPMWRRLMWMDYFDWIT